MGRFEVDVAGYHSLYVTITGNDADEMQVDDWTNFGNFLNVFVHKESELQGMFVLPRSWLKAHFEKEGTLVSKMEPEAEQEEKKYEQNESHTKCQHLSNKIERKIRSRVVVHTVTKTYIHDKVTYIHYTIVFDSVLS